MVVQSHDDLRSKLISERIKLADEASRFDRLISKQDNTLVEIDDLIEELRAIRRRVLEIDSQLSELTSKDN